MDKVIKADFGKGFSAIDTVKLWDEQSDAMRKAIHTKVITSYEESLKSCIELHQWRAEGYQDSNDFETAALEISMADGLIKALNLYNLWSL